VVVQRKAGHARKCDRCFGLLEQKHFLREWKWTVAKMATAIQINKTHHVASFKSSKQQAIE
jgi:hypothetical protein